MNADHTTHTYLRINPHTHAHAHAEACSFADTHNIYWFIQQNGYRLSIIQNEIHNYFSIREYQCCNVMCKILTVVVAFFLNTRILIQLSLAV